MSLLLEAVHKNDKATVLRLLKKEGKGAVNKRDGSDQTPLHIASYEGKLEMANFLLSKGADVRALDKNGWSPLHSAATSGEFQIRYIRPLYSVPHTHTMPESSKLLIEKGADVNSVTGTGTCPLHYLVAAPTEEDTKTVRSVLELMLEKGAHINAQNQSGETPLFTACMRCRVDNVAFLLEHGADVKATTHR